MKKWMVVLCAGLGVAACTAGRRSSVPLVPAGTFADTLRFLYSQEQGKWPAAPHSDLVPFIEPGALPEPPDASNPVLQKRITLGMFLFFDPVLSESRKISCAGCHAPELSWTDGRARSLGHEDQSNKRNSPSIQNTWFYTSLFWDGRSHSLEDQAFSPINSQTEMHSDMPSVISRLRTHKSYPALFDSAYGSEGVSPETLTGALAAFQRTITSASAGFDDFMRGDKQAMSDTAIEGLHLFRTTAGCVKCHGGPMFTDNRFHNIGLPSDGKDLGRYEFTKDSADIGKFRTPSLRDVTRTGPWMHDGSINNLGQAIDHFTTSRQGDSLLLQRPLSRQEKIAVIAFLEAISSAPRPFVRPSLPE